MNRKTDALMQRMSGARTSGAKSMWYMLFANAVADRLSETETLTRDDLRAIFQARLDDVRGGAEANILVPGYEECLEKLDLYRAERKAENGYEPTGL